MTPSARLGAMDIVLEPYLDWHAWRLGRKLVVGAERYAQLVFTVTVKPNILDLDPGPLDARVP